MRILFMGTPEFALPTLQALLESKHEVVGVVCQPDRPAGRNRRLMPPPVKVFAAERGLPVVQPERLRRRDGSAIPAALETFRAFQADAAVVVAYGRILPQEILDLPTHGCFNVHASLLPKYRGAAPINWAIMRGETQTGISIMQMDAGLDTGDVLATESVDILPDDDARSLTDMLSMMGARLMVQVLDDVEAGRAPQRTPQASLGEPSFAPPLTKDHGIIDWNQAIDPIICHINGLCPKPGAWTVVENTRATMQVLKAEPWEAEIAGEPPDAEPGQVLLTVKGMGFVVKTGSGPLLVTRVKPANKAEMDAASACNGGIISLKTRFIDPRPAQKDVTP